jgi:hypothetical protein
MRKGMAIVSRKPLKMDPSAVEKLAGRLCSRRNAI